MQNYKKSPKLLKLQNKKSEKYNIFQLLIFPTNLKQKPTTKKKITALQAKH